MRWADKETWLPGYMAPKVLFLLAVTIFVFAPQSHAESHDVPVRYKIKVLPDVRVRMRDGVELAVRITRPDAEGRFPAVMSYNPYRSLTSLKVSYSDDDYSNSLDAPAYLAKRGYISVNYDVRGTGASGGSTTDMYSDAERRDGYDMIEWIATQPWSTGNVGMWGLSYSGVVAWQVAAMAPPHLKAIIVGSGTDDPYQDWMYPGGAPRSFLVFGAFAAAMAALNFAPPDPQTTGEKWSEIWAEHLKDNVPWSIAFLKHQTDGKYWQARSLRPDYNRIKCAVFVISGWADWYPTAMLRAFSNLKVPKRALIGPWGHSWPEDAHPGPRIDARDEYVRWFDQFLKETDTGVLDEPPITIFVKKHRTPTPDYTEEPGFWRYENEWPLARVHTTAMYLASEGRLESEQPRNAQAERDTYVYKASVGAMSGLLGSLPALDQRPDEAFSMNYSTAPLERDLEVTGNPSATLFISSTAEVAYFHVRLSDVAPDGTSSLVSQGGLNATHRESHAHPLPLKAGETYEIKIDLQSISHIFPAGHRIRVSVSSADFQNAWPTPTPALNSLLRSMDFPSRIVLPIVPPRASPLPEPQLLPSPNTLPATFAQQGHEYSITYDLLNQKTTLSAGSGLNRTTYTVSDLTPAEAVIRSTYEYTVLQVEGEIKVLASTVTASDANVFRHSVQVQVTMNGKRHFDNSWTLSVPRKLN